MNLLPILPYNQFSNKVIKTQLKSFLNSIQFKTFKQNMNQMNENRVKHSFIQKQRKH